jgi:hypothetical protein
MFIFNSIEDHARLTIVYQFYEHRVTATPSCIDGSRSLILSSQAMDRNISKYSKYSEKAFDNEEFEANNDSQKGGSNMELRVEAFEIETLEPRLEMQVVVTAQTACAACAQQAAAAAVACIN